MAYQQREVERERARAMGLSIAAPKMVLSMTARGLLSRRTKVRDYAKVQHKIAGRFSTTCPKLKLSRSMLLFSLYLSLYLVMRSEPWQALPHPTARMLPPSLTSSD